MDLSSTGQGRLDVIGRGLCPEVDLNWVMMMMLMNEKTTMDEWHALITVGKKQCNNTRLRQPNDFGSQLKRRKLCGGCSNLGGIAQVIPPLVAVIYSSCSFKGKNVGCTALASFLTVNCR